MNIKDYQIVALGVMIALGSVFSSYVFSKGIVQFQKMQSQTIKVTGSASQQVTSTVIKCIKKQLTVIVIPMF